VALLIRAATDAIPSGIGSVSGEIVEYLKLIVFLAAVVVLAFVALRFWLPKLAGGAGTSHGPLHVAWRLSLEPRKTLYIVRAGSDYVLLAASDAGVQLLAPLDAGQMEAALRQQTAQASSGFAFADLMRPRRRSQPGKGIE
jgi:flagellar biogenesis protein FliO